MNFGLGLGYFSGGAAQGIMRGSELVDAKKRREMMDLQKEYASLQKEHASLGLEQAKMGLADAKSRRATDTAVADQISGMDSVLSDDQARRLMTGNEDQFGLGTAMSPEDRLLRQKEIQAKNYLANPATLQQGLQLSQELIGAHDQIWQRDFSRAMQAYEASGDPSGIIPAFNKYQGPAGMTISGIEKGGDKVRVRFNYKGKEQPVEWSKKEFDQHLMMLGSSPELRSKLAEMRAHALFEPRTTPEGGRTDIPGLGITIENPRQDHFSAVSGSEGAPPTIYSSRNGEIKSGGTGSIGLGGLTPRQQRDMDARVRMASNHILKNLGVSDFTGLDEKSRALHNSAIARAGRLIREGADPEIAANQALLEAEEGRLSPDGEMRLRQGEVSGKVLPRLW